MIGLSTLNGNILVCFIEQSTNQFFLDWSYFDVRENTVNAFDSPAMSGGLVAIDRQYFKEIGEYDTGMEIWGGEQIELSIRTWVCGGKVKIAPCSRVGHVFRMRRPYSGKPGIDTNAYNSLRTSKVWLDEWEVSLALH